ncbi:hypothetical protein K7472_07765 [Streptomyces sp. PTM05]|uniref:HTH HARE-type domain-containing protein n=1 Tax=Streptantibioticus parmotrematis TaxID=2873249 RepID=A0ABS7QNI1_9ACTN|nr:hypothetical protein [Streptantibioticus parmotrematis]MBY8884741.1 hypothetical protein [Streptantibioticus parmotrematis]
MTRRARAEVSQRVAQGAAELLSTDADSTSDPATGKGGGNAASLGRGKDSDPGRTRPTLADEIHAFVRAQGRPVRRVEIAEHLHRSRPDLKPTGLGPELTQRVRAGTLVRAGLGLYTLPTRADEGGDGQQAL